MTQRETNFGSVGILSQIAPHLLDSILAHASDFVISVDRDGKVLGLLLNPYTDPLASLDHWQDKNINDFLCDISQRKLASQIELLESGENSVSKQIELNHTNVESGDFPVRYTVHKSGRDGIFLMLGRDLRSVADAQQKLVRAQISLEREYEKYRVSETRYSATMEAARDALVFVDAQTGRIVDGNAVAGRLLGSDSDKLVGSDFATFFEERRHPEFLEELRSSATGSAAKPVTVTTQHENNTVIIRSSLFRTAGDLLLICRVEGKRQPGSGTEETGDLMNDLFENSLDAVVFTDAKGIISYANNGFLGLCDLADLNEVRGRSLSEFLAHGNVDLKILMENTLRTGKLRNYTTKLESVFGTTVPVELSVTVLGGNGTPTFGYLIRDSSKTGIDGEIGFALTGDAERNIMELVGSTKLKDIVAATTDVVERMCIDAAVNLTQNNRVAAAEMLGLSRQSLYVKLRKYGLLKKED